MSFWLRVALVNPFLILLTFNSSIISLRGVFVTYWGNLYSFNKLLFMYFLGTIFTQNVRRNFTSEIYFHSVRAQSNYKTTERKMFPQLYLSAHKHQIICSNCYRVWGNISYFCSKQTFLIFFNRMDFKH